MLRRIMLTVAVIAPLAFGTTVSAQDRAPAVQPGTNGNATGRPTTLPPGMARRGLDSEKPLPPGITRTRQPVEPAVEPVPEPVPVPEPQPEPEPEPEPTVCDTHLEYHSGIAYFVDCNGNMTPVFGG